jgi:C4-dicarboxylate-specific signal transduction histidine kinase
MARELLITTGKTASGDVLVAVRDSGPGLALAALERVFDPFYTSKPGGLGMGLSICRSIIEAHGGRLRVEANRPRGAIFGSPCPRMKAPHEFSMASAAREPNEYNRPNGSHQMAS